MVDQRVYRHRDEVDHQELDDGPQPRHRRRDRRAQERRLADRCRPDPHFAELREQVHSDRMHVLAENHDSLVFGHRLHQGVFDGTGKGHRFHPRPS